MNKIMTKVLLTFSIILFISCGNNHTDFSGKWIDKKNESDIMKIEKNGKNYIVENGKNKYPAQIKDDLLEISAELPIKATIDNNGILIVGGNEYIRYKNATKPKFEGIWKQENSEKAEYKIVLNTNGSLTLNLLNNEPWEEEGHSGGKKKISKLRYKNGHLTFRVTQKIDYNYRKWDMDLSMNNGKIDKTEKELGSPYDNGDEPLTSTYVKI